MDVFRVFTQYSNANTLKIYDILSMDIFRVFTQYSEQAET